MDYNDAMIERIIGNFLNNNSYVKIDELNSRIPQVMTVTDSDGQTTNLAGTCVHAINGAKAIEPYIFYASSFPNTGGNETLKQVRMVLPLGGYQTGLFRFPKIGEKVLVMATGGGDTAVHYMIGYVPDATNPIDQKGAAAAVFQEQGQVFRYRQTGKKAPPPGEEYSEIGFYHQETSWKAKDTERDTFADNKETVDGTDKYVPPKIDRINIHSTGDIHESAVNHHQVRAQRLELLAGENTKAAKTDTFKQGDIYIKAGKNITIEAGASLTLKVGRTTLTITDDKFSVSNQLMSAVPNPVDASISLNVRDGVAISGQTVGIDADRKWSLGDKFGGGISGTVGIVKIGCRELSITNQQISAQLGGNLLYMADYMTKVGSGGLAISAYIDDDMTRHQKQMIINHIAAFGKWFIDLGVLLYKYYKLSAAVEAYNAAAPGATKVNESGETFEQYNVRLAQEHVTAVNEANRRGEPVPPTPNFLSSSDDPILNKVALDPSKLFLDASSTPWYEKFAVCLDWILSCTKEIYKELNSFKQMDAKARDNLNFASLVVDQTLIATATGLMLGAAWGMDGNAGISLSYDGNVTVKAAKNQNFYAVTKSEGAATASIAKNWVITAQEGVSVGLQVEKLLPLIKAVVDSEKSLAGEKPEVL
jgi:phage baseplate assembly protein gpV